MLTTIGLVLNAIGALALMGGLFRGVILAGYGGVIRTPEQAAAERAAGTVGGIYLVLGFGAQLIASVSDTGQGCWTAAAVTFAAGAPLAFGLYKMARWGFLRC